MFTARLVAGLEFPSVPRLSLLLIYAYAPEVLVLSFLPGARGFRIGWTIRAGSRYDK